MDERATMTAKSKKPSVTETVDLLTSIVPWGKGRAVLVFRRTHAGKTYIKLRTWNYTLRYKKWYPSKRFFVMPIGNAHRLADAIHNAVDGKAIRKPKWLNEVRHLDGKYGAGSMTSGQNGHPC